MARRAQQESYLFHGVQGIESHKKAKIKIHLVLYQQYIFLSRNKSKVTNKPAKLDQGKKKGQKAQFCVGHLLLDIGPSFCNMVDIAHGITLKEALCFVYFHLS